MLPEGVAQRFPGNRPGAWREVLSAAMPVLRRFRAVNGLKNRNSMRSEAYELVTQAVGDSILACTFVWVVHAQAHS